MYGLRQGVVVIYPRRQRADGSSASHLGRMLTFFLTEALSSAAVATAARAAIVDGIVGVSSSPQLPRVSLQDKVPIAHAPHPRQHHDLSQNCREQPKESLSFVPDVALDDQRIINSREAIQGSDGDHQCLVKPAENAPVQRLVLYPFNGREWPELEVRIPLVDPNPSPPNELRQGDVDQDKPHPCPPQELGGGEGAVYEDLPPLVLAVLIVVRVDVRIVSDVVDEGHEDTGERVLPAKAHLLQGVALGHGPHEAPQGHA